MSEFTFPLTAPSHVREPRNQWTVSPEFGDALLIAMRERSQSGGPIPRLPSLLQLPSPEVPEKDESSLVTSNSHSTSYNTERLTMKTRVAVRDMSPHRFQVIPLRDAGSLANSLPAKQHFLSPKVLKELHPRPSIESPATAWSKSHSGNKLRKSPNENTFPKSDLDKSNNATSERPRMPSERTNITSEIECPPFDISLSKRLITGTPSEQPASTGYASTRRTSFPREHESQTDQFIPQKKNRVLNELAQRPTSLRTSEATAEEQNYRLTRHFKSPSLGNLPEKPMIVPEFDAATLPRIVCRKRTNTLSVDNKRHFKVDDDKRSDRQTPAKKKNSFKRLAIYTQSLYIPHAERSITTNAESCGDPNRAVEQDVFQVPVHSQLPSSGSSRSVTGDYPDHNALGINVLIHQPPNCPLSIFPWRSFGSQSSVSSVYSQDNLSLPSQAALIQTRPLTRYGLGSESSSGARVWKYPVDAVQSIEHHPIIATLLEEVDMVLLEWRTNIY